MPGTGIEPISKDFQSNALPLSYPDYITIKSDFECTFYIYLVL